MSNSLYAEEAQKIMNSNPFFSIIISTYHRNDLLALCLDCLAPGVQTLQKEQYEVIVSDDGRQITAEEMIRERYPWVKWVANSKTRGVAPNKNNGAQYAQGEWLAFTDDDCLPEPNWLSAFTEATAGEALALEGAIHPVGDPNQDLADCPVNLTGGWFWGANIAVERSLFEKVGGFDPDFPIGGYDDVDLQLRLSPLTNITFVPNARVFHPVRLNSLKKEITEIPQNMMAWAYHVNKNRQALGYQKPFSATIFMYKYNLVQLLRKVRHRHFKGAYQLFFVLVFGIPLSLVYIRRFELRKSTEV